MEHTCSQFHKHVFRGATHVDDAGCPPNAPWGQEAQDEGCHASQMLPKGEIVGEQGN